MKINEERIKAAFSAYDNGKTYKNNMSKKGMFLQNKINERFYRGDQWHGADCGNLPLVRENVIKRIVDAKVANITSSPVSVLFSAEGIPDTMRTKEKNKALMQAAAEGTFEEAAVGMNEEEEISFMMSALSDYFKICAERLKINVMKSEAGENAACSGMAIYQTFWDNEIKTGLFADEGRTSSIMGDVGGKLIDVENFYVADPSNTDLQSQEYILIAERVSTAALRREAKRNGIPQSEIEKIREDGAELQYSAGDMSEIEIDDSKRTTVLTEFRKKKNKAGETTVHISKFTVNAVVRDEVDTRLENYPFALWRWARMKGSFYGDSEVTHLVPNQIAINRMLSACVWNAILNGMPIMVVNGDVINTKETALTNEPGQVIEAHGSDLRNAMTFVTPPATSGEYVNLAQSLIEGTLKQSGTNEALLGDIRPDNTSAIIAVKEAAEQPLQTKKNEYYQFMEDIARLWAECWVAYYGKRKIKMQDENGTWYLPFDSSKYQNLLINVKVDVGPSSLYSELQTISTLDRLFSAQIIDVLQYLERLPRGYVPELQKLIDELKAQRTAAQQQALLMGGEGQDVTPAVETGNGGVAI